MTLDLTKPIRLKGRREERKYGGQVGDLHVVLTSAGSFANGGPVTMESIEAEYENVPEPEAPKPCEFTVTRPIHIIADNEASRYALETVQVRPAKDGVYLVATDGRRMVAIEQDGSVPRDMLVPLKVVARDQQPKELNVSFDGNKWLASDGVWSRPVEGRFPDISKVFPNIDGSVGVNLDAKLLAGMGRVLKNYDNKSYVTLFINPNKEGDAIAVVGEGGVGVLMPVSRDGKDNVESERYQYTKFVSQFKAAHPAPGAAT